MVASDEYKRTPAEVIDRRALTLLPVLTCPYTRTIRAARILCGQARIKKIRGIGSLADFLPRFSDLRYRLPLFPFFFFLARMPRKECPSLRAYRAMIGTQIFSLFFSFYKRRRSKRFAKNALESKTANSNFYSSNFIAVNFLIGSLLLTLECR